VAAVEAAAATADTQQISARYPRGARPIASCDRARYVRLMRKTFLGWVVVLLSSVALGHDAGPETKAQREHRSNYISKTVKHEREIVGHHAWTPEMNALASEHWKKAYRAIRVHEIAEDEHDIMTMTRADDVLKRFDEKFFRDLPPLVADAPQIPPAPTLSSPAAGTAIPISSAVTFKITPVAGATHYACSLYEPGGHYWSSYDPKAKQWGTSPDCTIAANDPRWGKFAAGKTHFIGRAIIPAKSKGGKDYNLWSDPVRLDVTLAAAGAK
jgi:hypothetical protein